MLVFKVDRPNCPTIIQMEVDAAADRVRGIGISLIGDKGWIMKAASTDQKLNIGFPTVGQPVSDARAAKEVLFRNTFSRA